MPTRKEQALLTRTKIINVAEKLIREKGYENIRIADVASACDMSAGNFYHYFKSLDELFDEIDSVKFYKPFTSLQRTCDTHVLSCLESYVIDWIDLMLSYYGSSYMYYWTRHYTLKTPPSTSDNRVGLIVGHVVQILNHGIERGELRAELPVKCIAYTIAFSLCGCSAYFGITADEQFIHQWAEEFSSSLIRGALAPYFTTEPPRDCEPSAPCP